MSFSVFYEAENLTMEEIAEKVSHVTAGGDHYPSHCQPR